MDTSGFTAAVVFYLWKMDAFFKLHLHLTFAVLALVFISIVVRLFYVRTGAYLLKHAERGDLKALCRLTARFKHSLPRDIHREVCELIADAGRKNNASMLILGQKLGNASDPHFKMNKPLALLWIKKAAAYHNAQAGDYLYSQAHSATRIHQAETAFDPHRALESLIGLDGVKKTVAEITDRTQLFKKRKAAGLSTAHPALHIIFLGNPGTGKTTVARILGALLKQVGYLSRGHVVEVGEGELIGQYVGETPLKVQKKIQQALGGILFIDEAYSILNAVGIQSSFAASAIAALVKYMEDYRDDLVVIAAGYPKEMMEFMNSNPGLRSRFTEIISFENYDAAELTRIFTHLCESNSFSLERSSVDKLRLLMDNAIVEFAEGFSNGRFVRNLFESSITHMSTRLAKQATPTKEELMLITWQDIAQAFEDARSTQALIIRLEKEKAAATKPNDTRDVSK